MSNHIGIYKITSPSGRVYIGQSWDISKRFARYKSGINRHQRKLCASFQKYGTKNHVFEIVIVLPVETTQPELDQNEQFYMDLYRSYGFDLLNIKEAGSRGRISEETKRKIGLAFKGRTISEEARRKISEKNKGKKRTDETKRLISAIQKGKSKPAHTPEQNEQQRQRMLGTHPSNETRRKQSAWQVGRKCPHISESNKRRAAAGTLHFQNRVAPSGRNHPRFGMKHSPESIAKMRVSHKGQVVTETHKAKLSEKLRGELNPSARLTEVQVIEIKRRYEPRRYTANQLAIEHGVTVHTIRRILNGRVWKHLRSEAA